jgi:A/G-specific adenine glycosylase
MRWYGETARVLPWRGVDDPYKVWVSEIMLQQTRVQAVIEHYREFLKKFPTIKKLAAAPEQEVLAAWSGLGYYRRARMLQAAAKMVVAEHGGRLPRTLAELRGLPGIGEYTAAAIASIAFGESVAVVDGNVERVLLRVTGRAEDRSAVGKRFVAEMAASLVMKDREQGLGNREQGKSTTKAITKGTTKAKAEADSSLRLRLAQNDKIESSIGAGQAKRSAVRAAPGEHNQAMMELGATVCLPRGPLCGECPVREMCRTRGEHVTAARVTARRCEEAYLFATRQRGGRDLVLLVQRGVDERRMAGMWELAQLSLEEVAAYEPVLAVKHSITNTNYSVRVYAAAELEREVLRRAHAGMQWVPVESLADVALTGLARKILRKMDVMRVRV